MRCMPETVGRIHSECSDGQRGASQLALTCAAAAWVSIDCFGREGRGALNLLVGLGLAMLLFTGFAPATQG